MKSKHVIEFKDTEIGKIPKDWNVKKISEIGKARNCVQTGPFGSLLHAHDYQEEGFPLILVKHIKNGNIIENNLPKIGEAKYLQLSKYILKEGDIVFTRVGYVGNTAYIEKKHAGWLISGQMLRIRIDNPQINNRFISYFFLTENFKKIAANVVLGSTRDSINTQILKDVSIPIPAKEEQDKIASIINTIIKKIQCIEHQNKILEQIAQTIFKSWFVDFDGVTEFEDSELGNIPKGWKIDSLESITNNIKDSIHTNNIKPDLSYIGLEHMPRGSIALTNWEDARNLQSNKFRFSTNQLLFGKLRPYFKKVGIAPVDGICSTDILVLDGKDPIWNEFILFIISSNKFIQFASQSTTGTRMPRSNWNYMKTYSIVIPSFSKISAFHHIAKRNLEKINNNVFEIISLTKICDALLPKLMSGKIRV